jgi:NTP pyrophosphatase (non-canonical NTP hydrolase)
MTDTIPTNEEASELAEQFVNDMHADFTLGEFQSAIYWINLKNGWFDSDRTFGDDVALIHSEVSEMFEAYRSDGLEDTTITHCTKHQPVEGHPIVGEDLCKPEGVGSELADILVRLLDTAERHDIDITYELMRKIRYNHTRSYRHGNKRV